MLLGSKHLSYEHKSKQFQREVDMKVWEEGETHELRVDKLLFSPEDIIVGCSIAQMEDGLNFRALEIQRWANYKFLSVSLI